MQLESVLSDLQEFFVSPILVDPPSARPDSKRWSGELEELQPEAPSSSSTSRSSVVFHAWRGQIVRSKIARPAAHHENAPELSNPDPEDHKTGWPDSLRSDTSGPAKKKLSALESDNERLKLPLQEQSAGNLELSCRSAGQTQGKLNP